MKFQIAHLMVLASGLLLGWSERILKALPAEPTPPAAKPLDEPLVQLLNQHHPITVTDLTAAVDKLWIRSKLNYVEISMPNHQVLVRRIDHAMELLLRISKRDEPCTMTSDLRPWIRVESNSIATSTKRKNNLKR